MSGIASVVAGAVGLSGMMVAPEVPLQRPTAQAPASPSPATTASPSESPPPAEAPPVAEPVDPVAPVAEPIAIPESAVEPDTEAGVEQTTDAPMSAEAAAELAADEAEFNAADVELDAGSIEWINDDAETERNRKLAGARTMVAAGALAGVGSMLMIIAAGVEGAKPECDFGLDDCADAPRKGLTAGLGVAGGLFAAGGAALVTVGVLRLRRLNASVRATDESAFVSLRGRF